MNEKLKELIDTIPFIVNMMDVDTAVSVWSKEAELVGFFQAKTQFLKSTPDIGFKLEDKNDKIFEVLRTGRTTHTKIPKEVFGVELEGKLTPVFDDREIVGVVTNVVCAEFKNEVFDSAEKLKAAISDTDKSISEITEHSNTLAVKMDKVKSVTEKISVKLNDAIQVVADIQQNSKHSNILALNASIESARAGEAGRGFSVVASEMKKFATSSAESSQRINRTLSDIVSSVASVRNDMEESAQITIDQGNEIKTLNNIFKNTSEAAENVSKICEDIVG